MKKQEKWPWKDECGCAIYEDQYYGFFDSGGVAGSFIGYLTARHAFMSILASGEGHWKPEDITIGAEHLGEAAVAIMSGREYINKLYEIAGDDDIEGIFGNSWSE